MYVDDVLLALADEQTALAVSKEICRIFQSMGMTLNKFISNSSMVLQHLPQEYLGPTSTLGESLRNEVNEEGGLS